MTVAPGILLLPPPSAAASTGTDRRRAPDVAAVAPSQPPRADRQDNASRREDVAPDRPGPARPDPSPGKAGAATRGPEEAEQWLWVDGAAQTIDGARSGLRFLAQQIAQEVLSSGLHREPWDAGQAAYRRAGGEPPLPSGGPALVQLAV